MIRGESVTVHFRESDGTGPGNTPLWKETTETVDNVVVAPGPREDVTDSHRPDGVEVKWTLHFPKPWAKNLRNASISVRGEDPAPVVGDPKPYTLANTPTPWWMAVEVERVDG